MNALERRRLTVFSRVKERAISVAEAGRLLGLSERQARRLWKRYRQKGDAGLIHGLRGKPGNAGRSAVKDSVLLLYRKKYLYFSASHAADFLAKDRLKVPRKTLVALAQGRGAGRQSAQGQTAPAASDAAQLRRGTAADGRQHARLVRTGPSGMRAVRHDRRATSQVFARFYETEDTTTAFDLFGRYVRRFGLPLALYVDRDSIYKVNDQEALQQARETAKNEPLTQFGRAMKSWGFR